jgi:diguanylate cyclase (GGDEF)-like protein
MVFSPGWLSASLALAAIATIASGWGAWRLPVFPGRAHFLVVELALLWWTVCVAIEHGMQSPHDAELFAELAHLGFVSGPMYWCLFVWNYLYGRYRPSPAILDVVIGLFTLVVLILALTNDSHHLIYKDVVMVSPPPHALFQYLHGGAYFAYHAVGYLCAFATYGIISYAILHADRVFRGHYIALAFGMALPWLFNVLYVANVLSKIPFDVTPFTIAVTNLIFYWLIRNRQLFDLLPIAHGLLLDVIPDPILVVDSESRIVECNDAARQLEGGRSLVGERLAKLPSLGEILAGLLRDSAQPGREVSVGSPARFFDIGQVPLTYAKRDVGRLVLMRDISHRKEAERQLQSAMRALEQQLHQNVLLQQKLREESIRDPLTGLHNRRFLSELAPVLFAEADRAQMPLALVMIDIDHFKRLNDGYGHAAGDAVLEVMGAFLRQNIRQADAVFRMGGEEFLVLLPRTEEAQALIRVDSWRVEFAARPVEHDGHALAVTYSAGLALYPRDAKTLPDLLHLADLALYQAKTEGRNRTCCWRPDIAGAAKTLS